MRGRLLRVSGCLLVLLCFWAVPPACDGGGSSEDDATGDDRQVEVVASDEEVEEPAGEDVQVGDEPEVPVCVPDCAGRQCGSDGCGGSCGNCWTLEGAIDNSLCQPDFSCPACGCGAKECGIDVCGSVCGSCVGDWTCNAESKCEPPPIQCDGHGFDPVSQYSKLKQLESGYDFHYEAHSSKNMPFDALVLDVNTAHPYNGPDSPGIYEAAYDNLEEGGLWLYMLEGWNGQGYAKLLVPTQGQVKLVSLNPEGGDFQGYLQDVVLREASIKEGTMEVHPLHNGKTWCLDYLKLEAEIVVKKNVCVETGTGYNIGDNIANFSLQSCDGKWVKLHSGCGKTKALWVVATAGW